jgi:hypothetical protein
LARKTTQGIDVDRLDQEISDLGVRVLVYKSTACPNMTSLESSDHDINCNVCSGMMIDFCPEETLALFQQQSLTEQFKIQGTFHMDEIMVTFKSGLTLTNYSRVDLLDFKEDFNELIQRQEGTNIDNLKYRAKDVLGLFTVTNNVKKEYHFGTDFVLDSEGRIEWVSANKPLDRQIYSVYYKYSPIFRAIKAVHRDRYSQYNLRTASIKAPKTTVNGKTFVKMPETWILKRDFLLENTKNDLYDPNS